MKVYIFEQQIVKNGRTTWKPLEMFPGVRYGLVQVKRMFNHDGGEIIGIHHGNDHIEFMVKYGNDVHTYALTAYKRCIHEVAIDETVY